VNSEGGKKKLLACPARLGLKAVVAPIFAGNNPDKGGGVHSPLIGQCAGQCSPAAHRWGKNGKEQEDHWEEGVHITKAKASLLELLEEGTDVLMSGKASLELF
jgi:hypothetical protein